jgi:hypothetical protein
MRDWEFAINEYAVINENAKKFLPQHIGELVQVYQLKTDGINDYTVQLQGGDYVFAKEKELNKVTSEELKIYLDYRDGKSNVLYKPTNKMVIILEVDILHRQVEILHDHEVMEVVSVDMLKRIENEGDIMVEKTSTTNAELIDIFFKHYENPDGTFTVPRELLNSLLDNIFVGEEK